ncbi:CHAD domain-containing protein [Muricoccus radiodurans]|uniref:CYTH and CHAD domain-containing protein n=1 Tax=Muricoccus radiodurans TaxID=2231721 RepID=UPI003CF47157
MTTDDAAETRDRSAAPVELEIKFQLSEESAKRLAALPALCPPGTGAPEPRREVTTYFDTPDGEIARQGGSLRIRQAAGHCVQTLKLRRPGANPFDRGEWEWPLAESRLDPGLLRGTPLEELAGLGHRLRPVFTADVRRSVLSLRREDAVIEVSHDEGMLRAGEVAEAIREIELELKEGEPGALFRFAAALHAAVPLRLGAESKSDRGWRLRTGQPRAAEDPAEPAIESDAPATDALRRILGAGLGSLLANLPAASAGGAEGVHGMRVAVRRLRAALALFRPHLDPAAEARFTAALRELGRALGGPRDWDVFCTQTLGEAASDGVDGPLLDALRRAADARRAEAHNRLREALAGPDLTTLVLDLMAWAEDPAALTGVPDGGRMAAPVGDLAPGLEARLERKVVRRGRHIRRRDDEALHALRKSLKRLRYGVAFLAPLHRPKRVRHYLKGCKVLQEDLGAFNDAAVAAALAAELLAGDPALAPSVTALQDWAAARQDRARGHLRRGWRRFRAESLPD